MEILREKKTIFIFLTIIWVLGNSIHLYVLDFDYKDNTFLTIAGTTLISLVFFEILRPRKCPKCRKYMKRVFSYTENDKRFYCCESCNIMLDIMFDRDDIDG